MAELMDLPVDLMMIIFVRLPAKTLLQLKCVCKSWYRLISSPNFASLHLDQTLTLNSIQLENSSLRFIFSSPYLSSAEFDTFDGITEIDHPFRKIDTGFSYVVGSCHGLLCLCNGDRQFTIFLYNPTTRTHKKLPFLGGPSSSTYSAFGFGYDPISKDYKFVRILYYDNRSLGNPFPTQVMVYSLRGNSWTRIRDVPHPFSPSHRNGVLVDGNLHWIHGVFDGIKKHDLVVSFNLSDHRFGEVSQPCNVEEHIALFIGVLEECLCLLANGLIDTDIWVMKEYGVVGSWTRLFKIEQLQFGWFYMWPIAYSMNRRELFLQLFTSRVVSLDLETMVIKEVKVSDFPRCFDTQVCVENLMMLKDADHETLEINLKHGKKKRWKRKPSKRKRKQRLMK